MKRFLFSLLLVVGVFTFSIGQNTVGLLSYDHSQSFEGYNLVFPHNQGTVYLLNNCGEIVHRWDDPNFKPGNTAYLMENGNLVVTKGNGAASNSWIHAGGGGEKIEIRDWDNNLVWEYAINDSTQRLHHDIEVLPNGNILAIVWERIDAATATAAGRELLPDGEVWPDKIVEIEPVGSNGANIVWEWRAWDHLIQDFDANQANFGVVANHPELINLNYTSNNGAADWHHANAIDYNKDLDHVMLSIPYFDEIWIIDHSTTTSQAAGHIGGNSGKGGDLIFRWGNPAAHDAADSTHVQRLFFNHDAHWMDIGLPSTDPDYGKILVFNNRRGADFSSVNIITPAFDSYSSNYPLVGNVWGPNNYAWDYTTTPPQDMYSNSLSGAQKLPNGNFLICVGRFGYAFEVVPSTNEIVWEYKTPLLGGSPVNQGDTLNINNNLTFRMYRYPADYGAFTDSVRNLTLTPQGYIELNPDPNFCFPVTTKQVVNWGAGVSIYPNPTDDYFQIDFETIEDDILQIEVFNIYGQKVHQILPSASKNSYQVDVANWSSGIYVVAINGQSVSKVVVTH